MFNSNKNYEFKNGEWIIVNSSEYGVLRAYVDDELLATRDEVMRIRVLEDEQDGNIVKVRNIFVRISECRTIEGELEFYEQGYIMNMIDIALDEFDVEAFGELTEKLKAIQVMEKECLI